MSPNDDEQDYAASIEESQRRLEEEQRRQDEEIQKANAETRSRRYQQPSSGGIGQISSLIPAAGGSEAAAAGLGGAGSALGGGIGSGASSVGYGGAVAGSAPSTVLPGIFEGATGVSGATSGAGGIFGGGVAGGAAAGGGGFGGAAAAGGPWAALAAAIVGHNQWAKGQGLRDNESFPLETGLEGRALFKDSKRYQEWGNRAVDGLGDEWRLAGLGSSPADLFNKNTWGEAAKIAASGGILGKMLKKLF